MGLLDRLGRKRSDGVLGRAVIVVNRTGGRDSSTSSLRTLCRAELSPLPEGSGPSGSLSQMMPSWQAHLLTAGMEVPALLDRESNEPVGIASEGLEEAIGRFYLELEPEHGTWERALEARRKRLREAESVLGPIKEDVQHAAETIRELPGGLRDAVREWRKGLAELGDDHPAGSPVEGVGFDAWVEIKAAIARDSVAPGAQAGFAEGRGVPPGRWSAIDAHWQQQVKWNQSARALYDQRMADAYRDSPPSS